MSRQLLIVASLFLAAALGLPALGVPMAGQLAVMVGVLAALACLRAGGESWAALGLSRPARPGRTLLAGLGVAVLGYVAAVVAMLVAVKALGWPPMQTARYAGLHGNLPALLGMLVIAWTTAGLGEELLFRGFFQGRLQALFGGGRGAGLAAAVLQAAGFGLGHAWQGATGILVTGTLGLVFGLAYLRLRSLWPLVIAHGLVDTLSLLAIYQGAVPPG